MAPLGPSSAATAALPKLPALDDTEAAAVGCTPVRLASADAARNSAIAAALGGGRSSPSGGGWFCAAAAAPCA